MTHASYFCDIRMVHNDVYCDVLMLACIIYITCDDCDSKELHSINGFPLTVHSFGYDTLKELHYANNLH